MANAAQDLTQQVFGGQIWNCYSRFTDANTAGIYANLGSLCRLALVLGFMLTAFQIARMVFLAYRDRVSPMEQMPTLLLKTIFIGALLIPPVYQTLIKYAFAGPADALANSVTVLYLDHYQDAMSNMMGKITDSASNPLSVIFSNFSGVASSVIASLVFWAACICAFILPMLQGALFLFIYYLGPVCLVFCLFDLTASVTKAWISMMLTVCWLGFFGSVAFLVADSCSFISSVSDSAATGEVITTAVYGVISIILFCMAWPICSFFFSATGALGGVMSPVGAVGAATSGMVSGVAVGAASSLIAGGLLATSGRMLKGAGAKGGAGYALGERLQNYGQAGIQRGAEIMSATGSRAERNANVTGNLLSTLGGVPFKPSGAYSPAMSPKKGVDVSEFFQTLSSGTLSRNPATVGSSFPSQNNDSVKNSLSQYLPEGFSVPSGTQVIPYKGESMETALQRTAQILTEGKKDLRHVNTEAQISHYLNEGIKMPEGVRIKKEPGESAASALIRTADEINAGTYGKKTASAPIQNEKEFESKMKTLHDAPPPSTVDEFRQLFPYTSPKLVQKIISPFLDDKSGKSIPAGTQIIPFKNEGIFEAKKRLGDAINQGQDIAPMQDRAFLSHLVSPQTKISTNARIVKNEGESFAAAALRTANTIQNKGAMG